ncbi:unnamed protein product, partial [Nesidiocoris tenuis]
MFANVGARGCSVKRRFFVPSQRRRVLANLRIRAASTHAAECLAGLPRGIPP